MFVWSKLWCQNKFWTPDSWSLRFKSFWIKSAATRCVYKPNNTPTLLVDSCFLSVHLNEKLQRWIGGFWGCHMSQVSQAAALTRRQGQNKRRRLPSPIPPYRWLSWWLPTRSSLSGPFLPPRRARRLQGGHEKASLPQKGGCYSCSLRVCKPRCPSEAKARRDETVRNSRLFFTFSFLAALSEKSRPGRKNMREKLDTCSPHYVSSANGNRYLSLQSSHC